jgi:hypothetical protein
MQGVHSEHNHRMWSRLRYVPLLGLALTLAACSSSGTSAPSPSSSAAAPPPSASAAPPQPSPTASGSSGSAGATGVIKTNWEAFFNGKTGATQKIALLQNGQTFASVIQAQAGTTIASGASAVVTAVVVESASTATVSYNVDLNGTPALSNQTGTAVYQDGMWKVGDVSFCALLTLENGGKAPSVCAS